MDRSDSRYCVYCNSTFHRGCITDHFYRNKYCPVCNKHMSLIFMRIGEPPEPSVKKREVPSEIRKPKWPHLERRDEVPVFGMDIPTGPLKRTDQYIPKARDKREFPGLPGKPNFKKGKIPVKGVAAIVIIVVAAVGGYYGFTHMPLSFEEEKQPESPWKVTWTYPLEGVLDIAASPYGIAIGGRSGLVVLDLEGNVLWQKEGEVTDVDVKNDIVVASNRGTIEVYNVSGGEVARYGEGTCQSVSLSELGILVGGLSDGGVVILDITGSILQVYETGGVGAVSISSDAAVTAYREGGIVYVLDILGEVEYAFEDGGSGYNRIIALSSGELFVHTGKEIYLYDGENVMWSAQAEGCDNAGLTVSGDGTQFAVNAGQAVLYSKDGQPLYTLPKGSCGGIAFSEGGILVSDSSNVYFLRLEEVPETTEPPEKEPEGEEEEEEEGEPEPEGELITYEDWLVWYKPFISQPGNSAEYDFTFEEEGKTALKMKVLYVIDSIEGGSTIETITMTIEAAGQTIETSVKRWINPEGDCIKAEVTIDSNVTPEDCSKTSIRGIDFRKLPTYNWESMGQEEITVGRGTFLCHKLQATTSDGVITMWITAGVPPVKIILEVDDTVATMELV